MKPPPKQISPSVFAGIPKPVRQALLIRLAMALVIAGSVWLALWSYFSRFAPVNGEYRARTTEQLSLGNDVQQLEMRWDPMDADRTEDHYQQAQKLLFDRPEEHQAWQREIRRQGQAFGLDANPQLGNARPHEKTNQPIALLQATVEIHPIGVPTATNSPYQRLLGFTRLLETGNKRTDLIEFSAHGSSNSVQHAKAVFQLWSRPKAP